MDVSRQTLALAIKCLIYYQKEFYGFSSKLHEKDYQIWLKYAEAVKELEQALEDLNNE